MVLCPILAYFFLYILGQIIWMWHFFQNMYSQCTWIYISFQNESDTLPYLETEGYIIQRFLANFSPWEFKAAVSYFSWPIALTHTLTVWVTNWCHRKLLKIPDYVNKIKAPILIHDFYEYLTIWECSIFLEVPSLAIMETFLSKIYSKAFFFTLSNCKLFSYISVFISLFYICAWKVSFFFCPKTFFYWDYI